MMIHEVTAKVGKHRARKRIGRGRGSGHGKTSGRGHNGAGSRSGFSRRDAFEGGSLPYFRRIPVRGFSNANFRTHFWIVNLGDILAQPQFAAGGEINKDTLINAGLIRDHSRPLKVLGDLKTADGSSADSISVKFIITAERVSASVRRLVEAAGGSVTEQGSRRDRIRGIDRQSGDLTPKNLTKKLKRSRPVDENGILITTKTKTKTKKKK